MRHSLYRVVVISVFLLCCISVNSAGQMRNGVASQSSNTLKSQIRAFKVTVLSTMLVAETAGIGEWGFSVLVEADGHRILVDTGARPQTVLQNARELNVNFSGVHEVILTHNHEDHVGGLLTLRRALMKKNPAALSVVYVARGIFYSRPTAQGGEDNPMIEIRKEYEATGGRFIEQSGGADIFPGAWLTGPVPRKYPEHNWSVKRRVQTPKRLVEDSIPEDQSLVLDTTQGLVVLTGCGHAGIVNILTFAVTRFPGRDVDAIIGGLHLFPASDQQLDWTGDEFRQFKVANLLGAHCTGIEAVYRLRQHAGLSRRTAVVGAVGSTFTLDKGIAAGTLAQ